MAGAPDAEWTMALPPTPDYRSHHSYDVPQVSEPGAYLVVASMRADFSQRNNFLVAQNFIPKLSFWFDPEAPHRWMAHRLPLYGKGPEVFVVRDGVPTDWLGDN